METLTSDAEGAYTSDEAGVFAERWHFAFKLKAKNQYATLIERHLEILRQLLHRMLAQARSEKLLVDFADILAEATYVENAMMNIGDASPDVALLGRHPQIMHEFES